MYVDFCSEFGLLLRKIEKADTDFLLGIMISSPNKDRELMPWMSHLHMISLASTTLSNTNDGKKSKYGPCYINVKDGMMVAQLFIEAYINVICGAHQKCVVFQASTILEIYAKFIKEHLNHNNFKAISIHFIC